MTSLIDHLRRDHDEVRTMLDRIDDTTPDERQQLFREVVSHLARHEAAEQALVHPRTRDTAQGERIADSVIDEEQEAEELMADMSAMDPESNDFLLSFRKLRTAVCNHADHEEETEFPRLQEALDARELDELGDRFAHLEQLGPTRAHPHAPNDEFSQLTAGPLLGLYDRARDAARGLFSS